MAEHPLTEETIAAYVDGALDAEEAGAVAARIAADPAAQAAETRLRRLNALLREAFRAEESGRLPAAVAAALAGREAPPAAPAPAPAQVVAFPARRRPAWVPAALAAGIALALGLGAGWFAALDPAARPVLAAPGPVAPASALHAALERLPSGTASPEGILPVQTLRDAAGRPCREFEYATPGGGGALTFGVACRAGGTWEVAILVNAPAAEPAPGGFVPASGPGGDALLALLGGIGGSAVAPAEEAALIAGGWK